MQAARKRLQRTPVKTTAAAASDDSGKALMTQADVIILYPYKCPKFMSFWYLNLRPGDGL